MSRKATCVVLVVLAAACGAPGQDLDDVLGGDGSSGDDLLGAAKKAARVRG